MGRVVHVKQDAYDVWVARGSIWGNPFKIGSGEASARGDVIEKYKEWIVRGDGRHLLGRLGELEGKTLGCFCVPKGGVTEHDPLVCHGQVLLKLVAWRGKKIEERRERQGERQAEHSTAGGEGRGLRPVPRRAVFCGSRTWADPAPIREALSSLPKATVIVAGGARGADKVAEREARRMGFALEVYPARWEEEGRGAGYRRNERMVNLPGVEDIFAFRRGEISRGTDHTIRLSEQAGLRTEVVRRP